MLPVAHEVLSKLRLYCLDLPEAYEENDLARDCKS